MKILFKIYNPDTTNKCRDSYELIIVDAHARILKVVNSDPKYVAYDVLIKGYSDKYELLYPQWTALMSDFDQGDIDNILLKNNIQFDIDLMEST